MICLTPKPNLIFFVNCIQSKEKNFRKRVFIGKWKWRIEHKIKRKLFNYSRYGNKEVPRNVNKKAR